MNSRSLSLIKKAADLIPAYGDFLMLNGISSEQAKAKTNASYFPVTSKKNYLIPNSIDDLIWDTCKSGSLLLCSTSGSTGEPYYFPRDDELSLRCSYIMEDFLLSSSYGKGPTLVIVGFGMGVWIGGVLTMRAFELAGNRIKYPVSILPTGYNKNEVFKALKKMSPKYSQTIIVGYPPFIKEVVDESPVEGIDLKKLNIRFHFAAESFTETFRNYVCSLAGVADPIRDTINVYGSADVGAMAGETPICILIRRIAREDPILFKNLFNQAENTPTLAQYDPRFIDFEDVDGELVLTSDGVLPLLRYSIGDRGGIMSFEKIKNIMERHNVDIESEIKQAGIEAFINRKKPFVYIYERIDMSVSLHGINIYPEFIKECLLLPEYFKVLTEKFTMSTKNDIYHNQFLQINIELQKNVVNNKHINDKIKKSIIKGLVGRSSEFAEIAKSRSMDSLIQVVLWEHGHPRYFSAGVKQKWVEKNDV